MPPKTMPMSAAQQAPLQDSLGMNPEYLLPHQRDLYRRYLQSITDYQGQKAKEPNNTQLDGAIAEARSHINQLAAAAAQHEKQYPTPELFAQYANQYRENLMQRRAEITIPNANPNLPANLPALNKNDIRIISTKNQQLATRVKEIESMLTKSDLSETDRARLRTEFQHHTTQMELLKNLFREKATPQVVAAAAAAVQAGTPLHDPATPATPPVSQSQPLTPTVRSAPPVQSISMASHPTLPVATSMGQLPRPSVNVAVPPARPTLTGGYPVGNPLLGTATPIGPPQAFHLSQDGDTRLLSKRKLQDLVKSIDPDERLEPDVEELLLEVADEFIDSVLQQSCKIARHRKGQMLEVKDVQLHLERNWNIRIPGYSSEEVRNVKKYIPTPAHAGKVTAVNQAKAMTRD